MFKPFFVSLSLPYSMIMTELGKVMITVFNYKANAQQVYKSTDLQV